MRTPNVRTTLFDEEHNMTYHVMAFRPLSYSELTQSVKMYLSQPKLRKRKTRDRNKTVTIHTLIG